MDKCVHIIHLYYIHVPEMKKTKKHDFFYLLKIQSWVELMITQLQVLKSLSQDEDEVERWIKSHRRKKGKDPKPKCPGLHPNEKVTECKSWDLVTSMILEPAERNYTHMCRKDLQRYGSCTHTRYGMGIDVEVWPVSFSAVSKWTDCWRDGWD